MKLRDTVFQANPLVEAQRDLGAVEMKIMGIGLSAVNPHLPGSTHYDKDFKDIVIPSKDVMDLLGSKAYYESLGALCESMGSKTVRLHRREQNEHGVFPIFRKVTFSPDTGLTIRFNDEIKPYVIDLYDKPYTKYFIEQIRKLGSFYAIRILELLLQYQNLPGDTVVREISIEDIRFYLNVPSQAYRSQMSDFRRNVLDTPIREINRKTCYEVSYETIKERRSVIGISFRICLSKEKDGDDGNEKVGGISGMVEMLRGLGIGARTARELATRHEEASIRANIRLWKSKEYRYRNPKGALVKAIEEDWAGQRRHVEVGGGLGTFPDGDAIRRSIPVGRQLPLEKLKKDLSERSRGK